MKVTIVSGARPNFMKIAPICRAIDAAKETGKKISYRIIYTGSKDDATLDASLFSDLAMKSPDGYLDVSGRDHSQVAASIMLAFEKELNEAAPFLRGKLSKMIEIRHTPELKFIYDESISYGEKIENIIENLNREG